MNDGTVKAWGYNAEGQLGVGGYINQKVPTTIPNLTNVKQLTAGGHHTFALMNDGTIKSWGYNDSGQLGIGDYNHRTSPTTLTIK
ncbi:Regulator of chromosome condensation (RCC1) repeat protein [compost metagenome]